MANLITHSVFLRFKDGVDDEAFFDKCLTLLKPIPGVLEFRILKERSPKNPFEYGLTMKFQSQAAYDAYSNHPDHVDFVENTWIPNVAEFQEIDYIDK